MDRQLEPAEVVSGADALLREARAANGASANATTASASVKRKPGRPRGARTRNRSARPRSSTANKPPAAPPLTSSGTATSPADVPRDQRLQLLTMALTVTGSAITGKLELSQPWTDAQSAALAQAWMPVLDLYAPSGNPIVAACLTTAVVLLPYGAELAYNQQQRRAARDVQPLTPDA